MRDAHHKLCAYEEHNVCNCSLFPPEQEPVRNAVADHLSTARHALLALDRLADPDGSNAGARIALREASAAIFALGALDGLDGWALTAAPDPHATYATARDAARAVVREVLAAVATLYDRNPASLDAAGNAAGLVAQVADVLRKLAESASPAPSTPTTEG